MLWFLEKEAVRGDLLKTEQNNNNPTNTFQHISNWTGHGEVQNQEASTLGERQNEAERSAEKRLNTEAVWIKRGEKGKGKGRTGQDRGREGKEREGEGRGEGGMEWESRGREGRARGRGERGKGREGSINYNMKQDRKDSVCELEVQLIWTDQSVLWS